MAVVKRTGPPRRQLPLWLLSLSHTTCVSLRVTQLLVSLCPQRPSTFLHKTLWKFPSPPFPYPECTGTLAVLSPFQLPFFTASETWHTKVGQLRTGQGRDHGLFFFATRLHSRRKRIIQKRAWLMRVHSFTPKAWVSLTGAEHLLTRLPVLGSGSFGRMDRKTGSRNRWSWCCSRQKRLCPWSGTSSRWAEQGGHPGMGQRATSRDWMLTQHLPFMQGSVGGPEKGKETLRSFVTNITARAAGKALSLVIVDQEKCFRFEAVLET